MKTQKLWKKINFMSTMIKLVSLKNSGNNKNNKMLQNYLKNI